MAGNHRSSTLTHAIEHLDASLGMAGNHRSSTLSLADINGEYMLGMAGNHRSSTLRPSPGRRRTGWGWPGITAQVHSAHRDQPRPQAGDGRESPLKYTEKHTHPSLPSLGMAG